MATSSAAALAQLARSAEPQLQAQVRAALESLQAAVPVSFLERAIESRDAFALHDLATSLPVRLRPAVRTLERAFTSGVNTVKKSIQTSFRGTDPFSIAAARRDAAKFVTGVTDETRKAIRAAVTRAIADGVAPRQAAKEIREQIGLSQRQVTALAKKRASLVSQGVPVQQIQARLLRDSDRLLRYRAELIARTEIMRAQNAGQMAAWRAARDAGNLGPSEKIWIVANDDRLCPLCAAMDGVTAPLDAPFSSGVDAPPLHPLCRCTVGIRPQKNRVPAPVVADAGLRKLDEMTSSNLQQQLAERAAVLAARTAAKQAAQAAAKAAALKAEEIAARRAALAARRSVGTTSWMDSMLAKGQVGQQLGSNPGGFYEDALGVRYYVKQYADKGQALTEMVANRAYADLKLGGPKSFAVQGSDGRWYFASRIVENKGTIGKLGLTKAYADKILDGFSADVLLANWDAVGTGLDNVVVAGKRVVRIDQGGALLFRAQGARKPFSIFDNIDEWQTFVTQNAYYKQVFLKAAVAPDTLGARAIAQIDAIEALQKKHGTWRNFVRKSLGKSARGNAAFIDETARLLEARANLLYAKRAQLQSIGMAPLATVRTATDWPITDDVIRFSGSNLPARLLDQANRSTWQHGAAAKNAIQGYTGSAYQHMNERLRRNPTVLGEAELAMQRALEASRPPANLELVWRGPRGGLADEMARWNPGDQIQLNGFQSTSIDPTMAHNWSPTGPLLEIKPARGMFVEHITRNSGEWEFILPHAQRYRVVGRKTIRIRTRYGSVVSREVIQLEML